MPGSFCGSRGRPARRADGRNVAWTLAGAGYTRESFALQVNAAKVDWREACEVWISVLMDRSTSLRSISVGSFFPSRLSGLRAAAVVCALSLATLGAQETSAPAAQTTPATTTTTTTGTTLDQNGIPQQTISNTTTFKRGRKKKDDKVVPSKDTKKASKTSAKAELVAGADAKLPDKQLYDKAMDSIKKGHFDVARLDLQTMLNTYPDSQYQMRAKLAIADSWYREGGTAALTQAESEYADFRVFFPNAPEAAEAQMRIGDIYFRQMDRPDRDYAKAVHAEEEYRRMLTDYPDSTLVPEAKQRLRDVQEVLATREADIASFYATRENWAAVIARDQTVVDTYPLYSHMDDVLVGLGDAYEAQARYVRGLKGLGEGPKAKLLALYDGEAADCYRKVVLEHSAAPHVEDARDRLEAMGLPIPVPTKEEMAESVALENSRQNYTFANRATLLFMHKPDTVTAARIGDPKLTDPAPTTAPMVTKKVVADFNSSMAPATTASAAGAEKPAPTSGDVPVAAAPPTVATPSAPLKLNNIPATEAGDSGGNVDMTPATRPSGGGAVGNSLGVEILNASPRGTAADTTNGLHAVGPDNSTAAVPAVEKPAAAPDLPNEITEKTPAAQAPRANGKKSKADYDKSEESSSKHKKKKGIKKVIAPL
jgi:outer membrane protein assembly factor BamD